MIVRSGNGKRKDAGIWQNEMVTWGTGDLEAANKVAANKHGEQRSMTELSDLYSDRIIALAAGIAPARKLDNPDAAASAHSKLCGSTIEVELKLDGGRIADYGHTVKACLLGQASAAIVAGLIKGTPIAEIRQIAAEMRAMLKSGGPPPGGRWAELGVLEPVREVKGRHASTLLVFEAILRALDGYEARQADGGANASRQVTA